MHSGNIACLRSVICLLIFIFVLGALPNAFAQTATGEVVGTVTDPSDAVLPGAVITIRAVNTGYTHTVTTSSSGTYAFPSLEPGPYIISFQAGNFRSDELQLQVPVGRTVNGDHQMQIGTAQTSVEVRNTISMVDTVQPIVEDVLTTEDIKTLPLNGRNFMDLAQVNPGVQIQDGGNIDPTKNGFTGISIQGRTGRSTRLELDGIDISDETVGSTTTNIPLDSIQEFQVAQSTLDPSTTLTSTGAVQIVTRSGANSIHGSAFYFFRNAAMAARIGAEKAPFDRSQSGFSAGGPFVKDRLFWFVDYEHTLQHGTTFTAPPAPFTAFTGAFTSPFHETMAAPRLDWNITKSWRAFYSFHYDQLSVVTGFGGNFLQPFANKSYNRIHTGALDGSTGKFTHSFRVGYMRFRDDIVDGRPLIPGLPKPFPNGQSAGITIGNDALCFLGNDTLCLGPNQAGDQSALQRNLETRYDGAAVFGRHILRYGFQFVHIPEVVLFNGAGLGPLLNSNNGPTETAFAQTGPFPGGSSNPLNYPLEVAVFGNGLPYFTELAGLGYPRGAFDGKRYGLYVADMWKFKPNLTVSLALRYNLNSGRTNSDLPGIGVLSPILPDANSPVHEPKKDFAPQLGVAWDPFKNGKTSVRAGIGIFYDDPTFTLLLFDRTLRIPVGLGNATPTLSAASPLLPGTNVDLSSAFGQPIGLVVDQIVAGQQALQAANASAAQNFNPKGIPSFLDPNGFDGNSFSALLDPRYRTPYSTQFNIGIQRQIGRSLIISADFLHNANVHSPLSHDVNLVGANSTFNKAAAVNAINVTEASFGCASVDCAISKGATISSFASNGLGSPASGLSGQFVSPGSGFAFAGRDPSFGQVGVVSMIGRGSYNALQVRLRQTMSNPIRGLHKFDWMANYNFSRFTAMVSDQDNPFGSFINARDMVNLSRYEGPNGIDRTHMFSASANMEFAGGIRVSFITRIYSALPATLSVPLQCSCPAEIFLTDLTGDGTGGDVLPGTNLGSFGRSVKLGQLNTVIQNFNSNIAGSLTPAGQTLVSAGLFTTAQMAALGGIVPKLPLAPTGQVGLDNFVSDDVRISWRAPTHFFHLPDSFALEPTVDIYNVVNKANYDPPNGIATSTLRGVLDGGPGSLNGTTQSQRTNRYGLGSGVFSQGIPRAFQIGLQLTF